MGRLTDRAPESVDQATPIIARDDLSPSGEGQDVVTGGTAMAGHALIVTLRRRREDMGLSVEDVAKRSRLSPETVAQLEGRAIVNPPLDALFRYGMALNALVTLGFEEIEEDDRAVDR